MLILRRQRDLVIASNGFALLGEAPFFACPKKRAPKKGPPGEGAGFAGPRPFCRARGRAKAAPAASALIGTSLSRSPLRSPDRPAPSTGKTAKACRSQGFGF